MVRQERVRVGGRLLRRCGEEASQIEVDDTDSFVSGGFFRGETLLVDITKQYRSLLKMMCAWSHVCIFSSHVFRASKFKFPAHGFGISRLVGLGLILYEGWGFFVLHLFRPSSPGASRSFHEGKYCLLPDNFCPCHTPPCCQYWRVFSSLWRLSDIL